MILFIIGRGASGKDTLVKELKKLNPELHVCVSHTTRDMRGYEVDGVDYHFVDDIMFDAFKKNNAFAETRTYNVADGSVWKYGLSYFELKKNDKDCVAIVDLEGYNTLKNDLNLNDTFSVYLNVNDNIRRRRYLKRLGENPTEFDLDEMERRLIKDIEDIPFEKVCKTVDLIIPNNTDIDFNYCVRTLDKILKWGKNTDDRD